MRTRKPLFFASFVSVLALAACDDGTSTTATGGTGGGTTSSTTTSSTTTTTSASTTGTGGMPNIEASDTCPGNLVELALDQTVVLSGTTVGANDDYKEFCADSDPNGSTSAPDVVYQVKTDAYCSFSADLAEASPGFDGAFQMRATTCGDRSGGDVCVNLATKGEHIGKELTPGTYFFVIDGANKTSGDFTLTLSCKTPTCGDGILNSGEEQCDPGAPMPGDGCGDPNSANACKFEATSAPDTCADITNTVGTIGIAKGQTLFVPAALPLFNTAEASDDYEGTCSFNNFSGPDQVFAVKPTGTGILTVIIGRDYNGVDYCQPPAYDQAECWNSVAWMHEADCSNDMMKELPKAGNSSGCVYSVPDLATNNVLTLTQDVEAGKTYYLFVEGDTPEGPGHSGPYLLNMKLQ